MINFTFSVNKLFAWPLEDTFETRAFFQNNELLITANKTHCLFPQSVEFLIWLSSLEGVRISSFNEIPAKVKEQHSNVEDCNEISFPELLRLSLESKEPDLYEKVAKNVRVISNLSEGIGIRSSYNFLNKEGYKDINTITLPGDLLENAVLIDTNFLYVLKNQEKHFLHIPPTQIQDYKLASQTTNSYDSSGHKPLRCILSKDKNDCKEELFNVQKGNCILVILENECFNLCFLDKNTDLYKTESISKENNPDLYSDLKDCKFGDYKTSLTIEDEKINEKIRYLVSEFSGKTTKICRRINRICYLAGILFHALQQFNENGIPVSETVFNLQHICSPSFKTFKEKYYTRNPFVTTNEHFYKMGLAQLRKINPNLNFSIPQKFEIIPSREIV